MLLEAQISGRYNYRFHGINFLTVGEFFRLEEKSHSWRCRGMKLIICAAVVLLLLPLCHAGWRRTANDLLTQKAVRLSGDSSKTLMAANGNCLYMYNAVAKTWTKLNPTCSYNWIDVCGSSDFSILYGIASSNSIRKSTD